MPGVPIGATVTLTYDLVHNPEWPDPDVGDWLVSYSERTESCFSIPEADRRGAACVKEGPADSSTITGDGRIYPIVWYDRSKRRRPR